MPADIDEFNINDIVFRGMRIINKSKTFLDISLDKTISERKKLRLLRLLNMFPNFAEMLKVYKNIINIDIKDYVKNVITNLNTDSYENFKPVHIDKDLTYESFVKELKQLIETDDIQKGGAAPPPAAAEAPEPEALPEALPAAPTSPTAAVPTAPAPPPAAPAAPTAAASTEPAPPPAAPTSPAAAAAAAAAAPAETAVPEEETQDPTCNPSTCGEGSPLYTQLETKINVIGDELNDLSLQTIFKSDTESTNNLLELITTEPYKKVYDFYKVDFTQYIEELNKGEKKPLQILLNIAFNPQYLQIIRELLSPVRWENAINNYKGSPLLIILNTVKSTYESIQSSINTSTKGISAAGSIKELIGLVVSIVAICTGAGAPFAASSAGVSALGLPTLIPLLKMSGEFVGPIAYFSFLTSINQDKEAGKYLLENIPPLLTIFNIFSLFVASIYKVVNTDNLCQLINFPIDDQVKQILDTKLEEFYKMAQQSKSINIDELFEDNTGKKSMEVPDITVILNKLKNIIINLFLHNIINLLGMVSTFALLSLLEKFDLKELKELFKNIKTNLSCPDHPINKTLGGVEFIVKFLNVPFETIGDLLPIPSFIKQIFGDDPATEPEKATCPNK